MEGLLSLQGLTAHGDGFHQAWGFLHGFWQMQEHCRGGGRKVFSRRGPEEGSWLGPCPPLPKPPPR